MHQIAVICGPTASGKSLAALMLAEKLGACIINADAMQVYKQLPILTSSPSIQEQGQIKHYLYNYVDVTCYYNVERYIQDTLAVLESLPKDKPVILVGGSGMYIGALLYGLHRLPSIDQHVRSKVQQELLEKGLSHVYMELSKLAPESAACFNTADSKRICRAYEVLLQSGKSIQSFYRQDNLYHPFGEYEIKTIFLRPEREFLYKNCNARFDEFINLGAVDEVRAILPYLEELSVSSRKILGLQQIANYLQGKISLAEAIDISKQMTRNFAKRQITWFCHQLKNKQIITFASKEEYFERLRELIF